MQDHRDSHTHTHTHTRARTQMQDRRDSPSPVNGFPGGSGGQESTCNAADLGSIPGWGRPPGGGHGNPLQYSCLESPGDRGAWRATVPGVVKSWTRLSDSHFHFQSCNYGRQRCGNKRTHTQKRHRPIHIRRHTRAATQTHTQHQGRPVAAGSHGDAVEAYPYKAAVPSLFGTGGCFHGR